MSSETRKLLHQIATQLGRSRDDMQPAISSLQKNWYDTKQSLKKLKLSDFQKFGIPQRLALIIIEKIGGSVKSQNYHHSQKMQIENPVTCDLQSLRHKLSNQNEFQNIIQLLIKIFCNIRNNMMDQKYLKLKKSNVKINSLIKYQQIVHVLQYGGFDSYSDVLIMNKVNIQRIDQCLEAINRFNESGKFDPYKAQITDVGGNQKPKQQMNSSQNQSSMIYNQKLAQLEKKREQIMLKPPKNRQVKIFQLQKKSTNKLSNNQQMDIQFGQQKQQATQDQKIFMLNVKQQLKKFMEDPKFINRRKQQYIDLLKKPVFSETKIRVKLPNQWVFQCKFAPLQTLKTLIDIFEEFLQDKKMSYYIYMTPPVQKVSGMLLRKTFYEIGCVPSAIFHIKVDDKYQNKAIMKMKKGFSLF